MKKLWTVVVITDTGKEDPHYSLTTRREARELVKSMRKDFPERKFRIRSDLRSL